VVMEKRILILDSIFEKYSLNQLVKFRELLESLDKANKIEELLKTLDDANAGTLALEEPAATATLENGTSPVAILEPIPATETTVNEPKSESRLPMEWSSLELQSLIKGANTIPGGTRERWEKIADYVRMHSDQPLRTTEEIIQKSKDLQKSKDTVDEESLQKTTKKKIDPRVYQGTASLHPDHPVLESEDKENPVVVISAAADGKAWSKEEQTQLESALRQVPSSVSNRWDEIAKCIPTRSKKEIMTRFKEIALAVQGKKK